MFGTALRKSAIVVIALVAALGLWVYQVNQKSEVVSQSASLQGRILVIASLLHAPGDENTMTVANSSLSTANKMRYEIQQDLLAGKSQSQIIHEFVSEYGEQVLATPSFRGFGSMVWTLPALVLLLLALLVVFVIRRLTRKPSIDEEPLKGSHESIGVTRMIEENLQNYF